MSRAILFRSIVLWLVASGCAHTDQLKATWYYVPDTPYRGMYVALLNQGVEAVVLEGLIVNGGEVGDGEGWRFQRASPEQPFRVSPGELALIPFTSFVRHGSDLTVGCRLPVSLTIIEKGRAARSAGSVAAMPSAIPPDYSRNCRK